MKTGILFIFFKKFLTTFSNRQRRIRGALFMRIMCPREGTRVLDLGGQPEIWDFTDVPLRITCLNLPGIARATYSSHHEITYVEGDACNMPDYSPGDFDLIFSNSVIEHVGNPENRQRFFSEIIRLSDRYWIQTPNKAFPIEAHCGMPFWWYYPQSLRDYFVRAWRAKLPAWTEMVEGTTFITTEELRRSLPGCVITRELFIGLPKSTIAYSKGNITK